MARTSQRVHKISRRLNYSITETGNELKRRPFAPGVHGKSKSRQKLKDYGIQLQEKQRVRFTYGVSEKQFRKTFDESAKMKGKHGVNFLKLLESRLDNIVYRLGLTRTRAQSRQLVNHGHILVDGKKVNLPSYRLKPGQTISLREKSKNLEIVKDALEYNVSTVPYVSFNKETGVGTFERLPEREEFLHEINEQLIVEFYSR